MSDQFHDTSSLVKYYIVEVGSAWVTAQVVPTAGNKIIISNLTVVEMIAVFARKEREGVITQANRVSLQSDFLSHTQKHYTVLRMTKAVISQAQNLLIKHPLRTLDSIQLACGLRALQTLGTNITFLSADQRLLVAAQAEGLATDDPNLHP